MGKEPEKPWRVIDDERGISNGEKVGGTCGALL